MRNREFTILEKITILDAGSEGMAVAKADNMVIFVPYVVPGDVVDIRIIKKKKSFAEGRAIHFHSYSEKRAEPWCSHFGVCGGCRWQNMKYEEQLFYKQKQVSDNLQRIGKLKDPLIHPILAAPATTFYRNRLDFTFSNHRWLADGEARDGERLTNTNALGFHYPQYWDKVVDITECFHQPEPSNAIRNEARKYALENGLTFYDPRKWTGFLRNLIVRNSRDGQVMVILVVRDRNEELLIPMLDHLAEKFPQISGLFFVVNGKQNDAISDLDFYLYKGEEYITETMAPFREGGRAVTFRIGPASFYQTNPVQAENLYRIAAEYADLKGSETVYDLYTGTGTIANYIAPYAGRVIGIESVAMATADAKVNSEINGISNTLFFTGESEKLLTPEFFAKHGNPEVIITDPPRSGMHEKVVKAILEASPQRLVYVSCNPATQARDISLLNEKYRFESCRPVDMFPQTQHVENVALLVLRDQAD